MENKVYYHPETDRILISEKHSMAYETIVYFDADENGNTPFPCKVLGLIPPSAVLIGVL